MASSPAWTQAGISDITAAITTGTAQGVTETVRRTAYTVPTSTVATLIIASCQTCSYREKKVLFLANIIIASAKNILPFKHQKGRKQGINVWWIASSRGIVNIWLGLFFVGIGPFIWEAMHAWINLHVAVRYNDFRQLMKLLCPHGNYYLARTALWKSLFPCNSSPLVMLSL